MTVLFGLVIGTLVIFKSTVMINVINMGSRWPITRPCRGCLTTPTAANAWGFGEGTKANYSLLDLVVAATETIANPLDTSSPSPGVRFSKVPKSFRTRKAIAKSRSL